MIALRIFLIANIIACFYSAGYSQKTTSNLVFKFTKPDLEKIFYNDNNTLKVNFIVDGFSNKEVANEFKKSKSLKKIKIHDFNSEQTSVSAAFSQNIDAFRTELEKNNIEYIFCDQIKIKVSNIITQEKALVLSQNVISNPSFHFDESCNKADNLKHFEYLIYYYETKLNAAYHNYNSSLLNGYVDKLQENVKIAKKEKEEFIQQYSK